MSGSVEIVLWLQEYKLQALEAQLARDGGSTEKLLQDMLDDLYHRRVPLDIQREISERLDAEAAAELAESGVIRAIQLHGQEDEEYIRRLRRLIGGDIPVIQAFSVQTAEDLQRAAESSADYVLLDQGSGGTGKTFDWSLAEGFTRPFLLAGGLGTDNLAEAIERLSPWAVDLSSSLEIGGLKDGDKIIEAVNIVRSFEQLK